MIRRLTWLTLAFPLWAWSQNLNSTLLGSLDVGQPGYANIWGWTSPGGTEYAILGGNNGTAFIDITNAASPVVRDFVGGTNYSGAGLWREVQVWDHYAYIVTESYSLGDSATMGVQIIDMSPLPDSVRLVRTFHSPVGSGRYFSSAHTVHISEGHMYINGGTVYGTAIFSLVDPENPVYRGMYIPIVGGATAYTHDCYVRNDTLFTCDIINGWVDVVDVRDKTNPTTIHRIQFPQVGSWWPHNAALSSDGNFLLVTDENFQTPGFLTVWDLRTLRNGGSDVDYVANYRSTFGGLVHNTYVNGHIAVMSYYRDGVHIVDISDPLDPVLVGNYDCEPAVGPEFSGAWGVYPFFASGKIVISDMEDGLFVFSHNGARAGRIRGKLRDLHTGAAIPSGSLNLASNKTRFADAAGNYTMGALSGSYSLRVRASGYYDTTLTISLTSGVIEERDIYLRKIPAVPPPPPTVFALRQNYPNPFNPTTRIAFDLPAASSVRVTVYNILGQPIQTVVNAVFPLGIGQAEWDGKDSRGLDVASGIYLYRMEATNLETGERFTESRRMILLR